jgi:hypothetical protein
MSFDDHARAHGLIDTAAVEGIAPADRDWLDRHLDACPACAARARATEGAVRGLRLSPVVVPPDLATRTQYRLALRAQEMPQRRYGWALWISLVLSWILGIASAPMVWRGFEWAGQFAGLPPLGLKLVFGLWWALPAALAAGIWAMDNRKFEER